MGDLSALQKKAVETLDGPVLVLSAAGTGKTRVLTHRIAALVAAGVDPSHILAVTFTNKAAREMKERLEDLIDSRVSKLWVGTFHSVCLRILRKNIALLGFKNGFTIFDEHDQSQLIRRILKEQSIEVTPRLLDTILSSISRFKVQLLTSSDAKDLAKSTDENMVADTYMEYQARLLSNNAVDFDDIITLTIRLLRQYPATRQQYQNQFEYVLVDEYQDVNHAQYVLTHLLAEPQNNLFVVGDDAQAIYGFRLADITNILNFERDYPGAEVIRLEQNYRSTQTIVRAANALINHNKRQKPKSLWTENAKGDPITVYVASNDVDEARYVAGRIQELALRGVSYDDCAVLYRTGFQSRLFEDLFIRQRIPYVVVNGLSFYERKEIKDVIAYLKVVSNPADSVALSRVINVPRRGVGDTTLEKFETLAKDQSITLYESLRQVDQVGRVSAAAKVGVAQFIQLVDTLRNWPGTLKDLVNCLLNQSGYLQMLKDDSDAAKGPQREEAMGRLENVYEFVSIVYDYQRSNPSATLSDFLQEMSLLTDADRGASDQPHVRLMTVHAAKGLEFDNVFVTGLEEDLFPHIRSIQEDNVEEERRLCYVAVTRAIKRLYLTRCRVRSMFGEPKPRVPSRFLVEIPSELTNNGGGGTYGFECEEW